MKITIIGHGNVGSALAHRLANAGHQIVIGARDLASEKLKALLLSNPSFTAKTIKDSVVDTDTIVVAVPAHLVAELAQQLGDLSGKVVIDTTNSVFKKPEPYATGFEALQKITGAEVAKCFNSTGAENMNNPMYEVEGNAVAVDMFVAGTSAQAKQVAMQLANDAGFIARNFGDDAQVPLLEQLCMVWTNLAMKGGLGRNFAFKVVTR